MDRKTMSVAVVSVAIAFLAITVVTANPYVSINTPLYTLRMEQVSCGKNFSPAQISGFTYAAGNGYNLNHGVSGGYGEPLADPTKPPACYTYECTCPFDCTIDYTCEVTCSVECVNTWSTCVNTCSDTCVNTCSHTCDDTCPNTCVNTCETCVNTCSHTCWDTCEDTCWTCDFPNP